MENISISSKTATLISGVTECSGPLDKDLKTKFQSTEYNKLREFLQKYFNSDSEEQRKMKSDKSFGFSTIAEGIVDGLPVKNATTGNYDSSENDEIYKRTAQTYLRTGLLTTSEFNQVLAERMGDNQLEAYKACLKTLEVLLGVGVFCNISGDVNDEFSIRVNYRSEPAGAHITLSSDAIYYNLQPLGDLVFKDGTIIQDGQSRTQFFKRENPTKSAGFSFNVLERTTIKGITLEPSPVVVSHQIPIGTIVASILSYRAFLKANNLEEEMDMSKAIWIPCDGRQINASVYSNFGIVPDLRGLFLRCVNDFGVNGAGDLEGNNKNPEQIAAGHVQMDALKSHSHLVGKPAHVGGSTGERGVENFAMELLPRTTPIVTSATGGEETRPKNMSVYYYIKINN